MISIKFKLILGLLTFIIGISATFYWLKFSPLNITVCEAAKNPKFYEGKNVQLTAFVQTHNGIFFFEDKSCNFRGLDAVIHLPENYLPQDTRVQQLISEHNKKYISAQIVIKGRINTTTKFQDYQPKFVIEATGVELISKPIVESFDEDMFEK